MDLNPAGDNIRAQEARALHAARMAAEQDLPEAIPGCAPWRSENGGAAVCPSVYCERCQTLRQRLGQPALEPFTVPRTDTLHPVTQATRERI